MIVYADYPSTAQEFTSTTPASVSEFGLAIASGVSENWKLEWKLAFSYSTESAAPVFGITMTGVTGNSLWGSQTQLYFDFDYGPGCTQNWDVNEGTVVGPYSAPNYPSAADVYHFVTITAAIILDSGYGSNDQSIIYPTVAVVTSGDICRVLQGFGTSTSY